MSNVGELGGKLKHQIAHVYNYLFLHESDQTVQVTITNKSTYNALLTDYETSGYYDIKPASVHGEGGETTTPGVASPTVRLHYRNSNA